MENRKTVLLLAEGGFGAAEVRDPNPVGRLVQLAKADIEDRLFEMPCKAGDTIWILLPDEDPPVIECEVQGYEFIRSKWWIIYRELPTGQISRSPVEERESIWFVSEASVREAMGKSFHPASFAEGYKDGLRSGRSSVCDRLRNMIETTYCGSRGLERSVSASIMEMIDAMMAEETACG